MCLRHANYSTYNHMSSFDPVDYVAEAATPPKKETHPLTEIIQFALIALIIVIPIRMFIAQPFIVSGASMENTFQSGEYLIVDQVTYRFEEPTRGDVVIFRYPQDTSKYFIKRIIGVDGHEVNFHASAFELEVMIECTHRSLIFLF